MTIGEKIKNARVIGNTSQISLSKFFLQNS